MWVRHVIRALGHIRIYKFKMNFCKTIFYSIKFKGCCVIGNAIISGKGGVKFATPKSVLVVGVQGTTNVPAQFLLNGILVVDGCVDFYKGIKAVVKSNASLSIQNGTYINEYSRIFCAKKITIGREVAISWHVNIMDTDMHQIFDNDKQINCDQEIHIGNHVWIGANSFIGKKANISDNTIIGSGSFVKGTIKRSGYIYAGFPVSPIKQFTKWL